MQPIHRRSRLLKQSPAIAGAEVASDALVDGDLLVYDATTGEWLSAQTLPGDYTFTGKVIGENSGITNDGAAFLSQGSSPTYGWYENDTAANEGRWGMAASGGALQIFSLTDADAFAEQALVIDRTGSAIASVQLLGDAVTLSTNLTTLTGDFPRLRFIETDAPAGKTTLDFIYNGGQLLGRTRTDADGAGATWLTLNRSGTTVTEIQLDATLLDFNGTLDVAGNSTFTGNITQTSGGASEIRMSSLTPLIRWIETDASVDEGVWDIRASSDTLRFRATNDAISGGGEWLVIDRVGTTVGKLNFTASEVELNAATLDVNGLADISDTLTIHGTHAVVSNATPRYRLYETDAAADEKYWEWRASAGDLFLYTLTDAGAAAALPLTLTRSGTSITQMTLAATELQFDGTTLDINAAADLSSTLLAAGQIKSTATGILVASSAFNATGSAPTYTWFENDTTADEGGWGAAGSGGQWLLYSITDADAFGATAIKVDRSGSSIAEVELNATLLDFNGMPDFSTGIALGGGATATMGTIGGSGPTAAAQNQWLQIQINSITHWIPVWS